MNRRRAAAFVAVAVLDAQAGHLLAYQARFAGAAQHLQSSGAHSYFPTLVKTLTGLEALGLLASIFAIGLARMLGGRRRVAAAPSLLRLLAALFTLQLALFSGQEALEARLTGLSGGSGLELVLWGTLGQLPVASVAAVALRWLFATVEPAAAELMGFLANDRLDLLPPRPLAPVSRPGWAPIIVAGPRRLPLTRRGPPVSLRLHDNR